MTGVANATPRAVGKTMDIVGFLTNNTNAIDEAKCFIPAPTRVFEGLEHKPSGESVRAPPTRLHSMNAIDIGGTAVRADIISGGRSPATYARC